MSEIRQQCEAERMTKEEIQRKYDDLRNQYDTELENLTATQTKDSSSPSSAPAERVSTGRGKRKGGANRSKRDGEPSNGDGDTNGENAPAAGVDSINDQKRKLERLQELENKLVGGEEANNEERKKKRKKKLNEMKEKHEQRKQFNQALTADDDDTLLKVFDNAQEQVRSRPVLSRSIFSCFYVVAFYHEEIRRTTNGKQTFTNR